jgi:hypothetical protein
MAKVSIAIEQSILDRVFAFLPANENAEAAASEALKAWLADKDDLIEDLRRIEEFERTRMGVPGDEVIDWLEAHGRGERPPMPEARYIPKS